MSSNLPLYSPPHVIRDESLLPTRLLTSGLLGAATIVAATLPTPQAAAVPAEPCNEHSVGNTRHEGTTKWLCYSYGQGRYGWIVAN